MNRCPTCTSTYCPIPMDGPIDATVYIYAERPGQSEERAMQMALQTGRMPAHLCLIGDAGREFNENYLCLAGLRRDDVRVGNVAMCGKEQNKKPSLSETAACAGYHMPGELAEGNPSVVILLGATACSLIPGLELESEHGIPRKAKLFGWEGWVVGLYHPAAGMHQTDMMTPMLEDWQNLAPWLESGRWCWPTDTVLERDYRLCETKREVDQYFDDYMWDSIILDGLMGVDTESQAGVHWSTQASISVGSGVMCLAKSSGLERLNWLMSGWPEIVLHAAWADLPMIPAPRAYRDTQQIAYHFGNLRQGLKPLARRLLGRKRPSWSEVVTPPSKDALLSWIADGFVHAERHWQTVTPRFHKKSGKELAPSIERSLPEKLLVELNGYTLTNPEYDTWAKLYERMPVEWLDNLVQACGPVPVKGIAHAGLEDAVHYGVSDADDTLALALLFDNMRREFVENLNLQPEDVDS